MFLQKLYNYLKTMKIQTQYNPFAVVSHPAGNEYIALKKKCHVLCPINFRKPCFKSKQQRFIINFKKYLTSKGVLSARTDSEDMTVTLKLPLFLLLFFLQFTFYIISQHVSAQSLPSLSSCYSSLVTIYWTPNPS